MPSQKVLLSTEERLDRAMREHGRNQNWVINQLADYGFKMSASSFSMKKTGDGFTDDQLAALSLILPGFTY